MSLLYDHISTTPNAFPHQYNYSLAAGFYTIEGDRLTIH
jgi:hypothetical protein